MFTPRRLEAGPPARKPPPGARRAARWALALLAVGALGLEGCQSLRNGGGLFSGMGCNGCGGGLFGRRNASAEFYEPPIITEPAEVVPGEIVTEPADSGAVIVNPAPGASSAPSTSPPADLELDPLPEPGGSGRSNGSKGSNGRVSSGSDNPKVGLNNRATDLADSANSLARNDSASGPGRGEPAPLSVRVLDDLPQPEDSPQPTIARAGGPESDDAEPLPPEAVPALGVAPMRIPGPSDAEPSPTASPPPAQASPIVSTPSIPDDVQAWAAPGIRSFSGVGPQLAAGSFPEKPGWEYLAQKGYRTLLDLRDASQIRPEDLAEVNHWGLRYVMLPTPIDQLNPDSFRRFQEEIDQAGARPLYFCDADGSRAAALWYAYRIQHDKVNPTIARRDAEIVGPLSPESRAKAESLALVPPPPTSETPAAPAPAPAPATSPAPTESNTPPSPVTDTANPADVPATASASDAEPVASTPSPDIPTDPTAWRPYAALFLSILVVPLAYWSSSSLSLGRSARARASLAAPSRKLRSLPAESDA